MALVVSGPPERRCLAPSSVPCRPGRTIRSDDGATASTARDRCTSRRLPRGAACRDVASRSQRRTDAPGWPQQTTNAIDSSPAIAPTTGPVRPDLPRSGVASAVRRGPLLVRTRPGHPVPHQRLRQRRPELSFAATPVIGDINRHNVADITPGTRQTVLSVTANGVTTPGGPTGARQAPSPRGACRRNGDGQTTRRGATPTPAPRDPPEADRRRSPQRQRPVEYRIDEQVISSRASANRRRRAAGHRLRFGQLLGQTTEARSLEMFRITMTAPKPGWRRHRRVRHGVADPGRLNGDGQLDVVMGAWNTDGAAARSTHGRQDRQRDLGAPQRRQRRSSARSSRPTSTATAPRTSLSHLERALRARREDGPAALQRRARTFDAELPLIVDVTGKGQLSIIVAGENGSHQGVISRYDVPTTEQGDVWCPGWRCSARTPATGSWTNPPLVQTPACAPAATGWLRLTAASQLLRRRFYVPPAHPPQPAIVAMAPTPTGKATGWRPPTAASSTSGTPVLRFHGSSTSTSPSWPWRPRRREGLLDGGLRRRIFNFATRPSWGPPAPST